jgi:hypothetical protein
MAQSDRGLAARRIARRPNKGYLNYFSPHLCFESLQPPNTIGGAGSVVTRNLSSNVVAVGPAIAVGLSGNYEVTCGRAALALVSSAPTACAWPRVDRPSRLPCRRLPHPPPSVRAWSAGLGRVLTSASRPRPSESAARKNGWCPQHQQVHLDNPFKSRSGYAVDLSRSWRVWNQARRSNTGVACDTEWQRHGE